MRPVTSLMAVALLLIFCSMTLAQYELEPEERPFTSTVCVDELGEKTYIFLHSNPVRWTDIEGQKNPVMGVTVRTVVPGKKMLVTAETAQFSPARVLLYTNAHEESNLQLRERLAQEAQGNYADGFHTRWDIMHEFKSLDISTARYESDRILKIGLTLQKYRGYDDEQKHNPDGSIKNLYLEQKELEVILPDHLYRRLWIPLDSHESSVSPWTEKVDDLSDLSRLIGRSQGKVIEVKDRPAPSNIVIMSGGKIIWRGTWQALLNIVPAQPLSP